MSNGSTDGQPAKSGWLKKLGIGFGVLVGLLVMTYFVATSAWFLKSMILPRASQSVGATITVEDASISPFSSVTLKGLKVEVPGQTPIATVAELNARYSLMDIIGGNINVQDITVVGPDIRIVMNADGTSNFSALTSKPASSASPAAAKPSAPPKINIGNIRVSKGTFQLVKTSKTDKMTVDVSDLNFAVDSLKNGGSSKITLDTAFKYAGVASTNVDELTATIKTTLNLDLGPDLMLKTMKGDVNFAIANATGAMADAKGLQAALVADMTMSDIRQADLTFSRGNAALGRVSLGGTFDHAKREGKLKVAVSGIGSEVLSFAGARAGINFNKTQIAGSYDLELKNQGQLISAVGSVTASQFSIAKGSMVTPVLDLRLGCDVTVDLTQSNAILRSLTLDGTQATRPLVKATLSKPLAVNWGKAGDAVGESVLEMTVTNFNLADWRPVLGTNVNAGILNAQFNTTVKNLGKQIQLSMNTRLRSLDVAVGTNRIVCADLELGLGGEVLNFNQVALALSLKQSGQEGGTLGLKGTYDSTNQLGKFSVVLNNLNQRGLQPFVNPFLGARKLENIGINVTNLIMDYNAKGLSTIKGDLEVANLLIQDPTGAFPKTPLTVAILMDATLNANGQASLQSLSGTLKQGGQLGLFFDVSGQYHMSNAVGQIVLKKVDVNETAIRPFAAPQLASNKIDTLALHVVNLTVDYNAKSATTVKGDLALDLATTNTFRGTPQPLSGNVKLDLIAKTNGLVTITQCIGSLVQNGATGLTFDASGNYDLTNNVGQVVLKKLEVNQSAIRPFAAAPLADNKIDTLSLRANNVTLDYNPKVAVTAKGGVDLDMVLTNGAARQPMTGNFQLDFSMKTNGMINLSQCTGRLLQGNTPGGSFEVTAIYDQTNQVGKFSLKLTDLNQNGLAPLVNPRLSGQSLESISINANLNADFNDKTASSVKGRLSVARLVMKDTQSQQGNAPLEASLVLDASMLKQVFEFRQCQLSLTPTARATNVLQLTGTIDMTRSNATSGNILLSANSLDLTPYYNMATAKSKTANAPATQSTESAAPTANANQEPPAITLPFSNFVAQAKIGQLYLRDINVSNWMTQIRLDPGRVYMPPFSLALNGAPVNARADVNLSIPGYAYDVALIATNIPIGPFVTSFSTNSKAGFKGNLIARLQTKGAGTTGVNLKKSLDGFATLCLTNAEINLSSFKGAWMQGFVGQVFGGLSTFLGIPDVLSNPLTFVDMDVRLGQGNINIQRLTASSSVVKIESPGIIPIADVFTNSPLNQPIQISLGRNVTKGLAASIAVNNADTNSLYAKLPDFETLVGTVGEPKTKFNKLSAFSTAVSAFGGEKGQALGNLLQGLTGQNTPSATNAVQSILPSLTNTNRSQPIFNTQPNTPATRSNTVNNLLDQFLKPRNK